MKYLRRLLWFIASRMIMFSVIISLLILTFYLAMNTANIYILLDDGMKLRTSVILTREDANELRNFFTDDYLNQDQVLNVGLSLDSSPYADYNITDYNHILSLEWMWSWPWEDRAQATIVERVTNITGTVLAERESRLKNGLISSTPPIWNGGRYQVTLIRQNGQWKIARCDQTKVILESVPTPRPSAAAG